MAYMEAGVWQVNNSKGPSKEVRGYGNILLFARVRTRTQKGEKETRERTHERATGGVYVRGCLER